MKLTCDRARLSTACAVAIRSVADKTLGMPALGCILMTASGAQLTVVGTDLETRSWASIEADITREGVVCLPPGTLAGFLDTARDDRVEISVSGAQRATITCGRAEVVIPGIDPDEFPESPDMDASALDITVQAPLLLEAFKSVLHAALTDDSRPPLNGVRLDIVDGMLELATADSFRVAFRRVQLTELNDEVIPDLHVIVQAKGLTKACRELAKSVTVKLLVDAGERMLQLETEAGGWSVRLLEGNFPDISRIIPSATAYDMTVGRAELLAAVKLVQPVAAACSNTNRLEMRQGPSGLNVSATTEYETAESNIDAQVEVAGPAIASSAAYLRQAIEAFSGDQLHLLYASPNMPLLLHNGHREEHVQVVLPMTAPK